MRCDWWKHVDSQRNTWTHQRLHGSMVSLKGKICRKQCFFLLPSNMGFPVDFPWFYWRGISCGYGSVWFKIGIPWSHFESNLNWENDAKSHGIWGGARFSSDLMGDVMAHQRRSRLIRSSGRCYVFFLIPCSLGFDVWKNVLVGFHIQLLHLSFPAFEEFQASNASSFNYLVTMDNPPFMAHWWFFPLNLCLEGTFRFDMFDSIVLLHKSH